MGRNSSECILINNPMKKQNQHRPPRIPKWFLERMSEYQEAYLITGDLEEAFHFVATEKGSLFALVWYWVQVIVCLLKYMLNRIIWRIVMLNNYFKIAFRNIKKHKGYSFINISGLAVGMAASILILLWVQDELSYDRFHDKANRIYRICSRIKVSNTLIDQTQTPAILPITLKSDFP